MKEQFIKNAQAAFLRDTIEFYNSSNLCLDTWGKCVYSPQPNSPGCAIGRHQLNPALCGDWDIGSLTVEKVARIHPGELGPLEVLGSDFLALIQALHDFEENWLKTGLSVRGRDIVRRICEQYGLPVDKHAENPN